MAGERVFLPRGVLTESSVGFGWSSLWLSCHFSLLGDEEFLPGAAQGESAACSLPTLPSQPGLWPYSSARSLTFVSAASEGKQYLWMGMAGSLEHTCLSVGTSHTVPYFSFVKFYLFSAVLGLAARACLWLW